MATKSKYIGECQLCGRIQKLPGDNLAKHGYAVMWNSFQGTCSGSKELPYELSCDLIKEYLPSALSLKEYLLEEKQKLLSGMEQEFCFTYAWLKEIKKYVWKWGKVEVETHTNTDSGYTWKKYLCVFSYSDVIYRQEICFDMSLKESEETIPILILQQNTKYVEKELEPTIKRQEQYVKWLEKRIENWELKELKPV